MFGKSWARTIGIAAMMASAALAGTFGTVVQIGGEAADLALDETRQVLYIANFTANRIDVMSVASHKIQTSINVNPNPSSLSISPDGHWLLVAHYGNNTAPATPANALTLIDLTANNAKQVISLGNPPLGVAFGLDNKALVVTTTGFFLFDPNVGSTQLLQTIAQVATNAIPQPPASFPGNIVQASIAASRDGLTIGGFGGSSPYLEFRYNVVTHTIAAGFTTSSPAGGPRTVSLADDGSLMTIAWWLENANFQNIAEWPNPSGLLNVGSTLIDSSRNLVYAQIPPAGTPATANTTAPILFVADSDNLTIESQLQLPENLAGKSILSRDHNTAYAISDSGITILPVGSLALYPRITVSSQDIVFRGNFCDRTAATQTLTITDPGGGATPFSISASTSGITISPSTGVTPAVVTVTVDPNTFAGQKGTTTATLTITSGAAVNAISTVRLLINSQDPSQRGSFIDIPGKVVDIAADPKRNVYYVLRQDMNQVLIFNASNNTPNPVPLRTCTKPTSMAITFDQQDLLVGCDNAQILDVFDLDTLQPQIPVNMGADYVESIAVASNTVLAMVRPADSSSPGLDQIDILTHSSTRLPTLGVYQNKLTQDTVLASSSNGSKILVAGSDGSVMIYDANSSSFTVSRKDFNSLGGAYAASNFNQFVVGNNLLDASGVPVATLPVTGSSSGFAFVNQTGYLVSAPNAASPGVIEQVDLTTGNAIQPTAMVEAPILGSGSSTTGGTSVWTRSIVPLPNQTAIITLSTSGITVLPWAYASAVAAPQITSVNSAADGTSPVAPGGLMTVLGNQLSPTNQATSQIPLPTALANSCLTVNGQPVPLIFVSQSQINAQMPYQAVGDVTMIVHTPAGVSDNFNLVVLPNASTIFHTGQAGPLSNIPTVVRLANGLIVTDSNPVHRGDELVIYLTGAGLTNPSVGNGLPAPVSPLALTIAPTTVTLGSTTLPLAYSGLAPGEVGVSQINALVPTSAPIGLSVPLTISQGGFTGTVNVRVID